METTPDAYAKAKRQLARPQAHDVNPPFENVSKDGPEHLVRKAHRTRRLNPRPSPIAEVIC